MEDCIHGMMEASCVLCNGSAPRTYGGGGTEIASVHFDTGSVEVEAPYNEEFISALKRGLPGYARSWDGNRRVWIIAGEWWDRAQPIVEEFFTLDGV